MGRFLVIVLLVAIICTGWFTYSRMQKTRNARVIAHGGGGKGCGGRGFLIHPADAVSSALWSE